MNELIQIGRISPLRQRLIDDMAMRRFSRETQRNYLRDVGRFATWLQRSPHTATAEDIRQFQFEQHEAGVPEPTMNSIVGALRFFFTRKSQHDVTWEMPLLKRDLAVKHKETFWVQARCRGKAEAEEFHYVAVQHTRGPMTGNLPALLEAVVVTVDYALHLKGSRARDHGYLFKIHPENLGALFPPPGTHVLD